MIDRAQHLPHHELNALIYDMVKLLQDWTVVVLRARRDTNVVAHKLAKFGMEMNEDKNDHFIAPQCVIQDYIQELVNPMT